MTITNTWNVIQLDTQPSAGKLSDYVVTVHWTLSASDGDHIGSVYGTVSFNVDSSKPKYTDFSNLTLDEVLAWVHDSLGSDQIAALKANVATQIEAQINPTIVTPPLPWL